MQMMMAFYSRRFTWQTGSNAGCTCYITFLRHMERLVLQVN